MREWLSKVNVSSFQLKNFSQIRACMISMKKAKHFDATTMFTYSHANTPIGQSECAYYLSYFTNCFDWTSLVKLKLLMMLSLMQPANQHNKACLCYYKLLKFHNKPILCISLHVIHYHTTCQCTISCKCLKTATKYQWTKKIAICFKIISQSIK